MYVIIIQARMGSTRLPGKIMKKILNKEIFLWVYDRCLKSNADLIIIGTSNNLENNMVRELCIEKNIQCHSGSEHDVLDRFYSICKNFDKNNLNIIRVTADCPFIDYSMINDMIKFYENNNYDYIINHSLEGVVPEGSGIEIFKYEVLDYLWKNEDDIKFREHVTGLLNKTSKYDDIIKKGNYVYKPTNIDIDEFKFKKISVDTEEEYLNAIKIAKYFNNYDFTYDDILFNYNNIFEHK